MYTDPKAGFYDSVPYSDGRREVDIPITLTTLRALATKSKGNPWDCFLARAVTDYVREHPDVFGHPVLLPYVIRSVIYLADRKRRGKLSHAYRYQHNLGKVVKKFDPRSMNMQKFSRWFIATFPEGLTMHLKPGERRRGEYSGPHTRTARRGIASNGAMRRAIEAGMLPNTAENRSEAERQMRGPALIEI
jgi:hypothetical protein